MEIEGDFLDKLSGEKYSENTEKEIKFYNYIPNNQDFKIEKNDYYDLITKIEKKVRDKTLQNIKNFLYLEKNPLNIVPEQNNIDLKRNLAPRLTYLQEQTEKALVEMMKENNKKN